MAAHRRHFLFHTGGLVTCEHTQKAFLLVSMYITFHITSYCKRWSYESNTKLRTLNVQVLQQIFSFLVATRQVSEMQRNRSLAYWRLNCQWPLHLYPHLLSRGRSANWPTGLLCECWMRRMSTLCGTRPPCCVCTSVLHLVCLGPGSTLISTFQPHHHHWCSPRSDLSWLLLALCWLLLLQPLLGATVLYCSGSGGGGGPSRALLFWHCHFCG